MFKENGKNMSNKGGGKEPKMLSQNLQYTFLVITGFDDQVHSIRVGT